MARRLQILSVPSYEAPPIEMDFQATVWTRGNEVGYMAYLPRNSMDGVPHACAVLINLNTGGHAVSWTSSDTHVAYSMENLAIRAHGAGWRPGIGRLHVMDINPNPVRST